MSTSDERQALDGRRRRKPWKDLLRVIGVGLFFVGAALLLKNPVVRTQLLDLDTLRSELERGDLKSSLLFIATAALVNAMGIPRIWICGIAGSLFGAVEGMILGFAATLAGSTINFIMGRSLLRGPINRHIPDRLRPWYKKFTRHGFRAILYLRLFPLTNATLTNLLGGASRMPYSEFILATAIGFLPFTIAFATLGSAAVKQSTWQMIGGMILFTAVAVGQWLWTRRAGKNGELTEPDDSSVTESAYHNTKGA